MKIKYIKILFCVAVISFISLMGIFTITNNNEYSYYEARYLTLFPKPQLKDFLDSEVYNLYTTAFSDQMFIKNIFVKIYHKLNLQRYYDEYVIGKEYQLFHSPLVIEDREEYLNSLKDVISIEMNTVAENVNKLGAEFIFVSIPRKDVLMNEYLPFSYYDGTNDYLENVENIREVISDKVNFIDAYHLIKKKSIQKSFFQTDHHLNIRGAYPIFEEIINIVNKRHNIHINSLEDEYEILFTHFNGSYNRKTGNAIPTIPEELNMIAKNKNLIYERYDNGEISSKDIFGLNDNYASAYMGNDYGETIVDTNLNEAPNILFVGTSFTNILESLSVYKFNKMVSIDYRHNETGKSIEDYVKEYDIDYVVFICSHSNDALNIFAIKQQLGK